MVGWSRRNRGSAARSKEFNDWFGALSGPEKEEYRRKLDEARNKEMRVLILIAIIGPIVWLVVWRSLA